MIERRASQLSVFLTKILFSDNLPRLEPYYRVLILLTNGSKGKMRESGVSKLKVFRWYYYPLILTSHDLESDVVERVRIICYR